MPFLAAPLLEHLRDAAPTAAALVPRVAGRAEPLLARYSRAVAPVVVDQIASQRYALVDLLARLGAGVTWLDEPDAARARSRAALDRQRQHARRSSGVRPRLDQGALTMPRPRAATVAVAAAVAAVALLPFFWSTTFFTDDHLLLAFARYAPNPLVAFVRDEHGGEFYRPLSMSLWWLLARIGHGTIWPYAIVGASLHLLVAAQVAWLLRALGGSRAAALSAAAFFWLSPETREAALWSAAFPDWLGTALVLGALLALLRERRATAVALATCAYLTKESAIVLPALASLVLAVRERGLRAALRAGWRTLALLSAPAVAYLLVRRHVLGGWGGTGDERAPLAGKLIQVASGVIHVVAGSDIFPEAFAWGPASPCSRSRRWWRCGAPAPASHAHGWASGSRASRCCRCSPPARSSARAISTCRRSASRCWSAKPPAAPRRPGASPA